MRHLFAFALLGTVPGIASAQTPPPAAIPPAAKPSAASPAAPKPAASPTAPKTTTTTAKTAAPAPAASATVPPPSTATTPQPVIVNITQPAPVPQEPASNNWAPGLVGIALLGTLGVFGFRYAKQRGVTVAGTLQQMGVEMPQDGANGAGQVQPLRPVAPPAPPLPSLADLPAATQAPVAAAFTSSAPLMTGPPRLVGLAGGVEGESFEVAQGLSIGRDLENDIPLSQDTTVSRRHARIEPSPTGGFQVNDQGSSNGTFVNGTRVSGIQPLRPGDQIQIGAARLRFEA